MHPTFRRWLALTLFWSFVGLVFLGYNWLFYMSEGLRMPAGLSVWIIVGWLFWVPLTPIVTHFARRYPVDRTRWMRRVALHLLLATALTTISVILFVLLRGAVSLAEEEGVRFLTSFKATLLRTFFMDLLVYMVIVAVIHAIDYYKKYREQDLRSVNLEHQLARAQLQTLRMQLNPHFLFNTLHAIHSLMEEDPRSARRMLVDLSDLLRLSLEQVGDQEVSLAQELAFLDRYLKIEQVRFQDRLTVNIDIDERLMEASVPNLILQPLVENAIKHGISRKAGLGKIDIVARREGDELCIEVLDNGPGIREKRNRSGRAGVGIRNTRERLLQLFGDDHEFKLENRPEGGAAATLRLPLRLQSVLA
jgi:two-component system, LytTR family, sensor kinase